MSVDINEYGKSLIANLRTEIDLTYETKYAGEMDYHHARFASRIIELIEYGQITINHDLPIGCFMDVL